MAASPATVPAAPYKERKWVPVFAVLGVVVGIVGGGLAAAGSSLTGTPEQVGPPVAVGNVQVFPLEGWEFAAELTEPVPGFRLSRGGGSIDVFSAPATGTSLDILEQYLAFLDGAAVQFQASGNLLEGTAAGGIPAVRMTYVGAFEGLASPIEGEVTALLDPATGAGIVFDGWAPQGQYGLVVDEVDTMIEDAVVA